MAFTYAYAESPAVPPLSIFLSEMVDIRELLEAAVKSDASDLHIVVGSPPILRIDGFLSSLPGKPILTPEVTKKLTLSLLDEQQKDLFLVNKELDFSFDYGSKGRFRVNAYFERGRIGAALRLIPRRVKTFKELGLPKICHEFSKLTSGLVLATGPTGHGKSSTLAAVINEINENRKEHVVTIEDPIEYVYENKQCIFTQRELHHDTHSWEVALRSVLREDPDVVLIGEMRDYETISSALTIAETGHLVLATLHTNSAAQSIDRIVDAFPEHQQAQVRQQLSNTLEVVFSQRLLPAIGGGRIPIPEILFATSPVRATIREGKTHLIDNIIQTSLEQGMVSLDRSLAEWVKKGRLERNVAFKWSLRPDELRRLLK